MIVKMPLNKETKPCTQKFLERSVFGLISSNHMKSVKEKWFLGDFQIRRIITERVYLFGDSIQELI